MDPPQPAARPAYYSTAYQQGQPGEYYTYPAGTSSSDLAPASPSPRASLDDIYSGRSGPRPRRTSVASSFAESVASSHVSSTHSSLPRSSGSARPPSMSEVSLSPRLHPGGSDGFLVDVPGAGIFEVPWSELVGLLVTSGAVECLPDKHIVKRAALFTQSLINSSRSGPPPSGESYVSSEDRPWSQPIESEVNDVATDLGKVSMHPFAPQPLRISRRHTDTLPQTPLYATTVPLPMSGHTSAGEMHGAASSSTLRGRDSTAEYRTPLQRAFNPVAAGVASDPSRQPHFSHSPHSSFEAASVYHEYQPTPLVSGAPIEHLPPAIQAQNLEFVERHARPHPGIAPSHPRQTHHHRPQPYSRPGSISSLSSSSSAHDSEVQKLKAPRALNSTEEYYHWNASSAQLFRATPGVEIDRTNGEILIFPPGTYYKVFKDDLEVLPSDGRLINEWLRSQHCVGDCRFRFEKKRPATIRAHFMGCKARQKLARDPIKRLCELQTQAQRRFKIHGTSTDLVRSGSSTGWSETSSLSETDETEGADGTESIHSAYDEYCSPSYGQYQTEPEAYDMAPAEHYQPIHALASPMDEDSRTSDFANALVSSTNGSNAPAMVATDWNHPWLAAYGLPDPSNGTASSALPDEPLVAAGSFLSMDD